jgi:diguanylate cyclase (GGDEF)-like protein
MDPAGTLDEQARLGALRRLGLLDTPPEERFDVFTRLAASVCGTPMATVSLVDESRVWFKSTLGLPPEVREVPRDIAACAKVIANPDHVMLVPDASKDPRLNTSPLVTGPFGMRFYAGVPLRAPCGEPIGSLCVIDTRPHDPDPRIVDALRNLAEGVGSALRETAFKDPLTGLGNRRLFEEALAETVAEAVRNGGAVGLVTLDIDRFQAVNDTLGHPGGDQVLREVGRRLAAELRQGDVGVRLGGDEFQVLLPRLAAGDADHAVAAMAARLSDALTNPPIMLEGQPAGITVSVGCAAFVPGRVPTPQGGAEWLVGAADQALYNAKKRGRGCVSVHAPHLDRGIGSKRTLAADLRGCLAADGQGLSLVLQPVCRAADRAVIGHEALLRWQHPAHGAIAPGDFVPVAERSGLAGAMDAWVLRTACRLLAAAGGGESLPPVAVNVTPASILNRDFVDGVLQELRRHAIAPERLVIELTERMFLDATEGAARAAARLMSAGIGVALDDFGAGHASFAYLRDIPFNTIKLDRSLTIGADRADAAGRRARAILDGVVTMAHAIDAQVVAEGVETEAQFQVLRSIGCDAMQGWLLGRPVPAQAVLVTRAA